MIINVNDTKKLYDQIVEHIDLVLECQKLELNTKFYLISYKNAHKLLVLAYSHNKITTAQFIILNEMLAEAVR